MTSLTNSSQFSNWTLPTTDLLTSTASFKAPHGRPFVSLEKILSTEELTRTSIPIGVDADGELWMHDLSGSAGILVAGITASGKSVFLDTTLVSLLYHNTPDEMGFILIDAKRCQFANFKDIPHLLAPIIYDVPQTMAVLRWVIKELERRYQILAKSNCRNIEQYTMHGNLRDMPRIVLLLDECSDLMVLAGDEAESLIVRIGQLSRAVGISLIMTTSRPSSEVLRHIIRANYPDRLAFTTASRVDSENILEAPGAEKLLGKGDALYMGQDEEGFQHVQAPYIEQDDIVKVTKFIRGQARPSYNPSLHIRLMVEDS